MPKLIMLLFLTKTHFGGCMVAYLICLNVTARCSYELYVPVWYALINVTAWCSYESYGPVLIWLWLRNAVMSHMGLFWFDCDCVMQLWVIWACFDLTVTAWCSYESYGPVLIWLWLRNAVLVKDPHFTLAHHGVSSSSVVRASKIDHGGSWVQIPSGARIFFRVSIWCKNVSCWKCHTRFKSRVK